MLFATSVLPAFVTDEDSGGTEATKVFNTTDGYAVIEAEATTYSEATSVVAKQDSSDGSESALRMRTRYDKVTILHTVVTICH